MQSRSASGRIRDDGIDILTLIQVFNRAVVTHMMAPMHHPATRHVMPVRQELGTRTIFNILGPLTNPAGVKRQLTGAFAPDLNFPMAETLLALGSEKAWLVHGADGMDEISITGETSVAVLENGKITGLDIHPEDAGLPVHPFEAILGGSPAENGAAFRRLLEGHANDLKAVQGLTPYTANDKATVYVLPDRAWARRLCGTLANQLVARNNGRSVAVLTPRSDGDFLVNLRIGSASASRADIFCSRYPAGGGRHGAGGIDRLPDQDMDRFINEFFAHLESDTP